jgi:Asp-tRNA(Asn)/Glu-tRNA(Gln) amidotransferase A subunit family amidase
VGAICRFVEDAGVVLAAINGADAADRFSIEAPFRFNAEADISGLTLGYLPEALAKAQPRSTTPRSRQAGALASRSSKFRCLLFPTRR